MNNKINWSVQQKKVWDTKETSVIIPSGMGATTTIFGSALDDIIRNDNIIVLVICESIKNIYDESGILSDVFNNFKIEGNSWDNSILWVKSVNNSKIKIRRIDKDNFQKVKLDMGFYSVYTDCMGLDEMDQCIVACMATDKYMIVENHIK